jgi:N-acetyl-anhydromuramyl-L-alanine amidase AmpD
MKAVDIADHETSFRQTGHDSAGKFFKLTPMTATLPNNGGSIDIVLCRRDNNDSSFYYKKVFTKQRIVLHFTMGYVKGDIATLSTPGNHISTPFVIARSGDIYNLWDSQYWSYHLGPGAAGGNTAMSQSSIGIEISNIGPLRRKGNNLVTTYGNTDVYCGLQENQFFEQHKYRKYEYYASFTDAQYKSVISLLRFLTTKYLIPRQFLPESERYNNLTNAKATASTGILSHVNFRKDKTDIGPAFDWNRIIQGVTA